ncbi:putative restriction endonuclease with zinc-ribbon domain [Cedratvirus kamchatka]|uniref:Restriction endonuclease with zinc-ribbon domain n=1 Tax=Cedratvirus kamchatka TaxID=2716914 RepID=A0A6G8MY00_9VIRU|nr:putative restriction endonuclease with zinc-ribbon domain [Cedratvirus kamchatka]
MSIPCPDCSVPFSKQTLEKYSGLCRICNAKRDVVVREDLEITSCRSNQRKLCSNYYCEVCWYRSFASMKKSQHWSQKNILSPRDVSKTASYVTLMDCPVCLHEYSSTVHNLVAMGSSCSYCPGRRRCLDENCDLCFGRSFASIENSKYWSDKNKLTPREIGKQDKGLFWFFCPDCDHEFQRKPHDISKGKHICLFCNGKELCGREECEPCYQRSFASVENSKYWSDKNGISPLVLFKNSQRGYVFDCHDCGHEFVTGLAIVANGSWCPYCNTKGLCLEEDCKHCENKSFLSSRNASWWSKKNKYPPRNYLKYSYDKAYFDCGRCGHEFLLLIKEVDRMVSCKYCSGIALCDDKKCSLCFNRSFASHSLAKYWSEDNNKEPREVHLGCGKKYKFVCEKNHCFSVSPNKITSERCWCPLCVKKTEAKLLKFIQVAFPNNKVETQKRFPWCKNSNTGLTLPFDFLLDDFQTIIELDGAQHFKQVFNWKSPEETQRWDKYKMEKAVENGYSVIRILQEDVFRDRNNWEEKLYQSILDKTRAHIIYIPHDFYVSNGY